MRVYSRAKRLAPALGGGSCNPANPSLISSQRSPRSLSALRRSLDVWQGVLTGHERAHIVLPHSAIPVIVMPYTAKVTRGHSRKFFSVDFRHPVQKDRAGRFGLKVRRGLGTTDANEAERLVAELNQLLADEAFHRPTARAAAQEKGFSEVVIDLFFRDIE